MAGCSRIVANLLIGSVGVFGFVVGTFLFDVPTPAGEREPAPVLGLQSVTSGPEFVPQPPARLGGGVGPVARRPNPEAPRRAALPLSVAGAIRDMPRDIALGVPITLLGLTPGPRPAG